MDFITFYFLIVLQFSYVFVLFFTKITLKTSTLARQRVYVIKIVEKWRLKIFRIQTKTWKNASEDFEHNSLPWTIASYSYQSRKTKITFEAKCRRPAWCRVLPIRHFRDRPVFWHHPLPSNRNHSNLDRHICSQIFQSGGFRLLSFFHFWSLLLYLCLSKKKNVKSFLSDEIETYLVHKTTAILFQIIIITLEINNKTLQSGSLEANLAWKFTILNISLKQKF